MQLKRGPNQIRTDDLEIRSFLLYPAELRGRSTMSGQRCDAHSDTAYILSKSCNIGCRRAARLIRALLAGIEPAVLYTGVYDAFGFLLCAGPVC